MKKIILAAAAVALLAGPPLTSAAFGENDDPPTHGDRPSMAERDALFDARLIGFQAALKLTADQQKNWPAFETALRIVAKDRADRFRFATDCLCRLPDRAGVFHVRVARRGA